MEINTVRELRAFMSLPKTNVVSYITLAEDLPVSVTVKKGDLKAQLVGVDLDTAITAKMEGDTIHLYSFVPSSEDMTVKEEEEQMAYPPRSATAE